MREEEGLTATDEIRMNFHPRKTTCVRYFWSMIWLISQVVKHESSFASASYSDLQRYDKSSRTYLHFPPLNRCRQNSWKWGSRIPLGTRTTSLDYTMPSLVRLI